MSSLDTVADLMEIAAITAPKTKGQDYVVVQTLRGADIEKLKVGMIEYGEQKEGNWTRDANNVGASSAVVLIGIKDADVADLNCAACGEETCIVINTTDGEFQGPQCALRVLDMGIALGSAVKMAGMLNVDNRIMYRAGVAARRLGLIDADFVMGIPLSVSGKSIYFDR
jgi:uncharacterized ferredoxin-like protein